MHQQQSQPPAGTNLPLMPHNGTSVPPTSLPESGPSRQPRPLQPRPPRSATSYSGEFGASALSPGLDAPATEPPRKRGRPSKFEIERRNKADTQSRKVLYPSPGRLEMGRPNGSPNPFISAAVESTTIPYQPQVTAPTPTVTSSGGPVWTGVTPARASGGSDGRPSTRQPLGPPEIEPKVPSSDASRVRRTKQRQDYIEEKPREIEPPGKIPLSGDLRALLHSTSESSGHPSPRLTTQRHHQPLRDQPENDRSEQEPFYRR